MVFTRSTLNCRDALLVVVDPKISFSSPLFLESYSYHNAFVNQPSVDYIHVHVHCIPHICVGTQCTVYMYMYVALLNSKYGTRDELSSIFKQQSGNLY